MIQRDIVIIGGGPAGLAAAAAARKSGVQDILILERDGELGGILNNGLNCRIPVRDLDEDELEDMDWE